MSQLASFYREKRVLVTGHTGFTGGWLVAWLKMLDAKVCGYGLPPSSRPNFFDATLLDRGIKSLFADIRDRETLANTFADFQPEIIFHAAMQDHASGQQGDSVEPFVTNVVGTLTILEEARLTGSTRAIVLLNDSETRELLAKPDWVRSTRMMARVSALAFAESFLPGGPTGIVIPSFPALIGGGDWSESRLLGKLVHGLSCGEPITVPTTAFNCLHVLDALSACLHLAQELFTSQKGVPGIWDFSHPKSFLSELEFGKRFASRWGTELEVESRGAGAPNGRLASSPLPPFPGWQPALSLDQAIAWTVDWYKAYLTDPTSARRTTDQQILEYSALPSAQSSSPAAATN